MIRCLKRIGLSLGLLLGSITFIVWFLWISSAQEPTYIFYEAWGEAGSNPGQFRDPTGIAVTADEVFVSDARNSRIQVFDHHGRFKHQITGRGLPAAELGRPMNLDIHRGELYAADYWNDCIQVYALDGTHRRNIGTNGSEPGQFNSPGGVAVDVRGEIYVADFYNQRIQHLNADGQFIEQWGTLGPWASEAVSSTTLRMSLSASMDRLLSGMATTIGFRYSIQQAALSTSGVARWP